MAEHEEAVAVCVTNVQMPRPFVSGFDHVPLVVSLFVPLFLLLKATVPVGAVVAPLLVFVTVVKHVVVNPMLNEVGAQPIVVVVLSAATA
jgi:hypothetical protein